MRRRHGRLLSGALVTALTITNMGGLMPMTAFAVNYENIKVTYATTTTLTEKEGFVNPAEVPVASAETTGLPAPTDVYNAVQYETWAATAITTGYEFAWKDGENALFPSTNKYAEVTVNDEGEGVLEPGAIGEVINLAYGETGDETYRPTTTRYKEELELAIADPVKDNFAFIGWDANEDGIPDVGSVEKYGDDAITEQSSDIDDLAVHEGEFTATLTLEPIFEEIFTITYDPNGGKGEVVNDEWTDGYTVQTVTEKEGTIEFSKEGSRFVGWSTVSSRTAAGWNHSNATDYDGNDVIAEAANIKLYAIWGALAEHTVKFDKNGGTGTAIADQKIYDGKKVTLPDPESDYEWERAGYHLNANSEWIVNATEYAKDTGVVINADTTFKANWAANTYEVEFDPNGGDFTGEFANQEMVYDIAEPLNDVTGKIEYGDNTFLGWALNPNATSIDYTNKASVKNLTTSGTVTLYAIWQSKTGTYTVLYDGNGSTEGSKTADKSVVLGEYVTYDNEGAKPFTRTGYSLIGWSTNKDSDTAEFGLGKPIPETYVPASSNITLYAIWKGKSTIINFDANGGDGTMPAQTFVFGTKGQKLSKNTIKREGYNFVEWTTKADPTAEGVITFGDENPIEDEDILVNGLYSDKFVLYAQWEEIDADATEKVEEATAAVEAATATAEAKATAANNAATAANNAAAAVEKEATDANIAAAKSAAEAATKAAGEATAAAKDLEDALKDLDDVLEETADASVDQKVLDAAATAIENAETAANNATDAAKTATTAATKASEAAKKAEDEKKKESEKAADGSAAGAPAAAGTELVDANGNKTGYKVTDASASNPEVEYEGPADKNATKADIPETTTDLSGNTYKVTGIVANAFKDTKVKTVTIRKNIKKIDPKAFNKSKVKNVKIKGTKLTKKMAKSFKKVKKGGWLKVSGKHKAKNKEILNALPNVKNGKTKVK